MKTPQKKKKQTEMSTTSYDRLIQKARVAAQNRRDAEEVEIRNLQSVLPYASADYQHSLDKASIIRLATAWLRLKSFLKDCGTPGQETGDDGEAYEQVLQSNDGSVSATDAILTALNGFMLIVSVDGVILYCSDNVADYIGMHSHQLMGKPLTLFLHEDDCDDVVRQLHHVIMRSSAQSMETETNVLDVNFFAKMKSHLTKTNRRTKQILYTTIHFEGRLRMTSDGMSCGMLGPTELMCICRRTVMQPQIAFTAQKTMFLSRHSMDMKFIFCEPSSLHLVGYEPNELLGIKAFEFHNPLDSMKISNCHSNLKVKGTSMSKYYRFLGKTGQWVWMQTRATIVFDAQKKPLYVVCMNYVVSPEEGEKSLEAVPEANALGVTTFTTINQLSPSSSDSECLLEITSQEKLGGLPPHLSDGDNSSTSCSVENPSTSCSVENLKPEPKSITVSTVDRRNQSRDEQLMDHNCTIFDDLLSDVTDQSKGPPVLTSSVNFDLEIDKEMSTTSFLKELFAAGNLNPDINTFFDRPEQGSAKKQRINTCLNESHNPIVIESPTDSPIELSDIENANSPVMTQYTNDIIMLDAARSDDLPLYPGRVRSYNSPTNDSNHLLEASFRNNSYNFQSGVKPRSEFFLSTSDKEEYTPAPAPLQSSFASKTSSPNIFNTTPNPPNLQSYVGGTHIAHFAGNSMTLPYSKDSMTGVSWASYQAQSQVNNDSTHTQFHQYRAPSDSSLGQTSEYSYNALNDKSPCTQDLLETPSNPNSRLQNSFGNVFSSQNKNMANLRSLVSAATRSSDWGIDVSPQIATSGDPSDNLLVERNGAVKHENIQCLTTRDTVSSAVTTMVHSGNNLQSRMPEVRDIINDIPNHDLQNVLDVCGIQESL